MYYIATVKKKEKNPHVFIQNIESIMLKVRIKILVEKDFNPPSVEFIGGPGGGHPLHRTLKCPTRKI